MFKNKFCRRAKKAGGKVKQRIIFLDIDGTLTRPGTNVAPESAIRAIARARSEGHLVFLCTGRNYDMLRPLLKYEFDGFIASMGGYIECQGRAIYDCPMTESQRRSAMEILEKNNVFRTVECMDGSYTDDGLKEFLRVHAAEGSNSELLRLREQIEKELHILPMREYQGQPVYKILIMSRSEAQLSEPKTVLDRDFFFCMQEKSADGFINGEIVNRKFDKGKAIGRVCSHLHIPIENSIAFGDSMNDREMLEAAGVGICMEDGSAGLKNYADDICPGVQNDGIRQAFLKYGLIQE